MYKATVMAKEFYELLSSDTREGIETYGLIPSVLSMARADLLRVSVKVFETALIAKANELFPDSMAKGGLTMAYTYIEFMGVFWEIGLVSDPAISIEMAYPETHDYFLAFLEDEDVFARALVDECEGMWDDLYYLITNKED